jgi:hypothetical protein
MKDLPEPATKDAREFVAKVVYNRGRQVDLQGYLRSYPDEFLKGVLIAGSIGSGKTERALIVVRAALESGYGVLVFDPSADYQRLVQVEPEAVVLDFSEFYLNPLEPPPGLTFKEWGEVFVQVFTENFGLKDPSVSILQKAMAALAVSSAAKGDGSPTLEELLEEVQNYEPRRRSSEESSHASVLNRLESVLASEFGRCLNVRHGFAPSDFEEGLLVVQLRPVGIERVHELLVSLTVAKLFAYRSWRLTTDRKDRKNVLIVIEEAHRFLSESRQGDRVGHRLYLERALVEGRKLGVGFMVVDQLPHLISSYVLSSCNLWLTCKLMDAGARRLIGESLCLDEVWTREGLMELPVGAAFLRVERTQELEAISPLVHRYEDKLFDFDLSGLPAVVAVPEEASSLLQPVDGTYVLELMYANQRYMRYFERNLRQEAERIRGSLSAAARSVLDAFVERTLKREHSLSLQLHEHCGLDDSVLRGLCRKLVQRSSPAENSTDRIQVEQLRSRLHVLGSTACLKVLERLETREQFDLGSLSDQVGRSVNQTRGVLNRLCRLRLVCRVSEARGLRAVYALTVAGREALMWARETVSVSQTHPSVSTEGQIDMDRNEFEWLLGMIERGLSLRESSVVGGWRGDRETVESLSRLYYLAGYALEKNRLRGKGNVALENQGIFKLLKLALDSGVLMRLLETSATVPLHKLKGQIDAAGRTVRRHVQLLENSNIVQRVWQDSRKCLVLTNKWKRLLAEGSGVASARLTIDARLLGRMTRTAIDCMMIHMVTSGDSQWEDLETTLAKCAMLEET